MNTPPVRFLHSLFAGAVALLVVTQSAFADTPREHLSLDASWKFHLGDDWPDAIDYRNAGHCGGAAGERFDDANWRIVNLPHDWAIELPFDQTADRGHGYKALGPTFPRNSIGWYRRTFSLPNGDKGERIWLTFDGVYRDSTVFLNNYLVRRHESGYYPFREDITDLVEFGGTNTIAVRVDASKFEGWFYEGAGIYRHVWLDKTAPVAIVPDGVFVQPTFEKNIPKGAAQIAVEITLLSEMTDLATATVNCEIISPSGKSLNSFSNSAELVRNSRHSTYLESTVSSPDLWSPESPNLYKLITTISVGGNVVDRLETAFGIRTVGFDSTEGFLLNGKHYELYGTCNHQDAAGVGTAIPDALQYFRVARLKESGCNAIRTSHNPPTQELLEACDRLGMLVMDEKRVLASDSQGLSWWDEQIRRDRNHPSVAIWSVANEEVYVQDTEQAANIASSMQSLAKQLDPLRPVTYASPEGDVFPGINSVIEVRGWNYNVGADMDRYHAEHPTQPNLGTEQASAVTTRGIYTNDRSRGYVAAYDGGWTGNPSAESWWSYFAPRPWLSGGFVWTGFDYRGEPTPYDWPCINSHFGILDMCGFPKDTFYYYKSWWTTNPVLHLLPHWNWPGREGQKIMVEAFSNCKQVEIFLNGVSLGRQTMEPNSKMKWEVKYAPGILSAKGFDGKGAVVAETKVETTGDATQIRLEANRKTIDADGKDVAVFTVAALDAQGRVVPVAMNRIHFAIEGAGKILGVGNGDPSCHEPDVFIQQPSVRFVTVNGWRWKTAEFATGGLQNGPQWAPDFDDASWSPVNRGELPMKQNETAIYRAHVTLTSEDLNSPSAQIRFSMIDDHGWIYVNGRRIGESLSRQARPVFEVKDALHVGDNVIAVGVESDAGQGGLNPAVNLAIPCKSVPLPWSRSLFNGLAQILVQSTRYSGEIKLTATADGLASMTAIMPSQACAPAPAVP